MNSITIDGRRVELVWTQRAARLYVARASKAGVNPFALLRRPKTRVFGIAALIWCFLPADEYARHDSPEELFAAMSEDEWESDSIAAAIAGLFAEMEPQSAEKKSTSMKSPLPESS
jgi:hypothetical protein